MKGFSYVYILESKGNPGRHYTGFTSNLATRLQSHNSGSVLHTSKFIPWRLTIAVAFRDVMRARAFECYLKTASGRAFAKKHL